MTDAPLAQVLVQMAWAWAKPAIASSKANGFTEEWLLRAIIPFSSGPSAAPGIQYQLVPNEPVIRRTALSGAEWRVLLLLVISGFLNYFDRSNLSAGATDIQRELHLSSYQLGILLSAFFRTYAAFQLFAISGWLVDRFNVCWILAIGFFLWSGATALTGAAQTFAMVFALRLFLGMGESIAYPAYSRILANNFPEHHRGLANAIIDAEHQAGAGSGKAPAGRTADGHLRMARVLHGAGLQQPAVADPLAALDAAGQGSGCAAGPRRHSLLLGHPQTAFRLVQRAGPVLHQLLLVFPAHLAAAVPGKPERHFSKQKMAWFGSAAYFAVAISGVTAGWLSDRMIARGGTPTRVRKSFTGIGLLFSTLILPVSVIDNDRIAMTLLMVACLSYGLFSANLFAMTQTLAGPRAAGKWTGMQNGFGNLAGVAAPWLTGFIVAGNWAGSTWHSW